MVVILVGGYFILRRIRSRRRQQDSWRLPPGETAGDSRDVLTTEVERHRPATVITTLPNGEKMMSVSTNQFHHDGSSNLEPQSRSSERSNSQPSTYAQTQSNSSPHLPVPPVIQPSATPQPPIVTSPTERQKTEQQQRHAELVKEMRQIENDMRNVESGSIMSSEGKSEDVGQMKEQMRNMRSQIAHLQAQLELSSQGWDHEPPPGYTAEASGDSLRR